MSARSRRTSSAKSRTDSAGGAWALGGIAMRLRAPTRAGTSRTRTGSSAGTSCGSSAARARAPSRARRPSSRSACRRRSPPSTRDTTASARSPRTGRTRSRSTPSRCRRDRGRPTRSRRAGTEPTGTGSHRREIEVAARGVGRLVAPGMGALGAGRRSVRGAVELRLGRKPPALPARVRRRLGVAHVDGPRQRQRHEVEHAPPEPGAAGGAPRRADGRAHARRARASPRRLPQRPPGRSRPPRRTRGSRVRHVVRSIANAATSTRVPRQLVVPAERDAPGSAPSVARPAGTRTDRGGGGSPPIQGGDEPRRAGASASYGQPVPDVEQRLLVHRLVLEDGVRGEASRRSTGFVLVLDGAILRGRRGWRGPPAPRSRGSRCATARRSAPAAAASSSGSMPRSNRRSYSGSDAGSPSPRFNRVLTAKAGRCPS